MTLTLEQAQQIVDAALEKASEIGVKMNAAVVCAGGHLLAFNRQPGAWLGSIDIAINKARTARYFDMETAKLGKISQPGEMTYGIEVSNGGLIIFGGGIPVKAADGTIIGAVGVSGGTVDQDVKCAEAGLKALQ